MQWLLIKSPLKGTAEPAGAPRGAHGGEFGGLVEGGEAAK